MISGLLWLLGTLEGLESESESLATLTEITTSLLLIGGFSWEDIRSSGRDRTRDTFSYAAHVEDLASRVGPRCTLSLDVRDVQSVPQSKDHNPKLQIKGITRRHDRTLGWKLNHVRSVGSFRPYWMVLM